MESNYLQDVARVWNDMTRDTIDAETAELMLKVAVGLKMFHQGGGDQDGIAPEPDEPEPKAKPKKKTGGPKLRIDWGKVGALHKAGWDAYKIADEMGASPLTIRQGISSRKWETYVGEEEDENGQEDQGNN